jgi:hypothetical protein
MKPEGFLLLDEELDFDDAGFPGGETRLLLLLLLLERVFLE